MISDGLAISIIGFISAILAAYITVRYRRTKPKSEYVDTAFDALTAIIKRQDAEITRLTDELERRSNKSRT